MGAPVASGTLAGSTSGSSARIRKEAARSDFSRFRRHPRVVRFAHLCRRSRSGYRRRARLRNRTRSSRARSASSAVRDSSVGEARRRESAVVCQQPPVVGSTQFGGRRRSRPRGRRDNRNRGKGIAGSRPSGRSLSGNAIVARVARLGAGAPLSLGESTSGAICSRPSLHEARTPGVCADAP